MIKPPFNYTGNKNRLFDLFSTKFFPSEDVKFLDLFGGGATISVNAKYSDITYNDISSWTTKLIKALKIKSIKSVTRFFERMVDKYQLTSTHLFGQEIYRKQRVGNSGLKALNEEGYLRLRSDINDLILQKKDHALHLLFLSFYSFNNDVRFNGSGLVNIPIGKTDYNSNSHEKIVTFMHEIKEKQLKVLNKDFREIDFTKYDFIYADPPYYSTTAIYNSGWTIKEEQELQSKLDFFVLNGGVFALSNVSWHKGIKNSQLLNWAKNNNYKVINIDYSYRASSYNKKRDLKEQEVIITNAKNL